MSRKREYTQTQMDKAVELVKDKTSVYKAAKLTGVPEQTLRDRIKEKVPINAVHGGQPLFPHEQEAKIKDHVAQMATYGYGYTAKQLIHLATDTARYLQLRDSLKPLSKKWYQGFMRRWPEVKLVKSRGMNISRVESASLEKVQAYFEELQGIFAKYDLSPERIYNIDETGFSPEHKAPKVTRPSSNIRYYFTTYK